MGQRWGWVGSTGVLTLCCGLLFACSQAIYYQVRSGDTLSGIAARHGMSTQEIARYNAISDPDKLDVGQMLRIPPGKPQQVAAAPKSSSPPPRVTSERWEEDRTSFPERKREDGSSFFIWPLEGKLSSKFGPRNGSFHDGIDIAAPLGTSVRAAADGRVIFSDVLRGYGNVVIVRHAKSYLTVYAHHRVNLVKEGQMVRQGDVIAEVGQTGRATGASLHFEVRKDNLARNPLQYLPQERNTVRRGTPSRTVREDASPRY
ncbi:MAG: peptidoglycan DD-metalloendopeptidase family protein [Candidatus Binatia bacterium]